MFFKKKPETFNEHKAEVEILSAKLKVAEKRIADLERQLAEAQDCEARESNQQKIRLKNAPHSKANRKADAYETLTKNKKKFDKHRFAEQFLAEGRKIGDMVKYGKIWQGYKSTNVSLNSTYNQIMDQFFAGVCYDKTSLKKMRDIYFEANSIWTKTETVRVISRNPNGEADFADVPAFEAFQMCSSYFGKYRRHVASIM